MTKYEYYVIGLIIIFAIVAFVSFMYWTNVMTRMNMVDCLENNPVEYCEKVFNKGK